MEVDLHMFYGKDSKVVAPAMGVVEDIDSSLFVDDIDTRYCLLCIHPCTLI